MMMSAEFEKFYKDHYDEQLALVEDLTYEDQREKMLLFGFFKKGFELGQKNRLSDGEKCSNLFKIEDKSSQITFDDGWND